MKYRRRGRFFFRKLFFLRLGTFGRRIMKNSRHGGLSGKERVYRLRERVARKCAEDWVSECLEPDGLDRRSRRVIPIRGRADFLPTMIATELSLEKAGQLELNLSSVERDRTQRAAVAFRPMTATKRASRFSIVQFAWGCALGGAAAAVLLLAAWWIIG
jgi:hypothetical protein